MSYLTDPNYGAEDPLFPNARNTLYCDRCGGKDERGNPVQEYDFDKLGKLRICLDCENREAMVDALPWNMDS